MFQKVNDWLSDHGGRFFRSGEAGHNAGGAYYASQEAEQAYGGMGAAAQDTEGDTARTAAADTMNAEGNDPYGGRVPYRSQKQMQADAEQQRRREAEEQARQQQAAYQQQQQTQAYPQAAASAAYQQPSNILPFPGMLPAICLNNTHRITNGCAASTRSVVCLLFHRCRSRGWEQAFA